MSSYQVLVTDYAWPDLAIERSLIEADGGQIVEAPDQQPDTLQRLAVKADVIMTCWAQLPACVLNVATNCRLVTRFGIGLDNIDVQRCSELSIPVTNVPDYCRTEVAEHALGLMICLARNIGAHHQATKEGTYDLEAGLPIYRLAGRTLGIIGFGRIGRSLAEKAGALGILVITSSRQPNIHPASRRETLQEVLGDSDFVSLHLPLNDDTRHTIGPRQLRSMKKTAFLINTARGELVHHDALEQALLADEIAGAGLDVHEPEPPDLSRRLYRHPRVIATPHSAFVSDVSVRELRTRAASQVVARMNGKRPENVVNPEVL